MVQKQPLLIFHLYRKDGTSVFLHPFGHPEKIVRQLENGILEGRYGREPRVEGLTLLRNELYRLIELGVKNWLSDVRFIPKFLISALVFVVVYFLMSYVVRDPLPVIDEVAIGLGAAIAAFLLLGRRDLASKDATRKRMELRVVVDKAVFRESNFVKRVEEELHRAEGSGGEEAVRGVVEPALQGLGEEWREEAAQFLSSLEGRFDLRRLARQEKALRRRLKAGPVDLKLSKVDLPLYAVYKSLKKAVGGRKP